MSYKAHKKQALAHKAFLQDGYKRGVLLMVPSHDRGRIVSTPPRGPACTS